MLRVALSILAVSAVPTAAQTAATTTPRIPCTAPAPPDSLTAAELGADTWTAISGIFVSEFEAVAIPSFGSSSEWTEETIQPGYTGDSYYHWTGGDWFTSAPPGPSLTYNFEIVHEGDYKILVRNMHNDPNPTEANDVWMQIDDGQWEKAFHNDVATSGQWNWEVKLASTEEEPEYHFTPGLHKIEFKGRSHGFKIDRIHIHALSYQNPKSTGLAQSPVATDRPVIGTTLDVEIDDATNFASLTSGSTFTAWFSGPIDANDPCGTVFAGFGANGGGGELLVGPLNTVLLGSVGTWSGGPVSSSLSVPNSSSLVGKTFVTQAVFIDIAPGAVSPIVVTDGLDLLIGDI